MRRWSGCIRVLAGRKGRCGFGDFGSLVFSDIPNNRMLRYCEVTDEVTLFRQPSNYSNGNTRDLQGRLITCEHLTRRVTRTEHDGRLTVLLDRFEGKRLNGPNDVVVDSRGAIWFTDPGYGIVMAYEGERAEAELPTRVYRLDPVTGSAAVVADDLVKPNGLCFSPDESRLYISDTGNSHDPDGPGHIRVFEVVEGRKLRGGQVFADMSPGICRRHTDRSRRQPVVQRRLGRTWNGRRALPDAGGRPDRPDRPAGTLRQLVLRRRQAKPPVHDRQPVAVCVVRGGCWQPEALAAASALSGGDKFQGACARSVVGVESFRSVLKRAHKETFHKISPKHLDG